MLKQKWIYIIPFPGCPSVLIMTVDGMTEAERARVLLEWGAYYLNGKITMNERMRRKLTPRLDTANTAG